MDGEALLHVNFHQQAPDRVAMASMLRYEPQVAVPRLLEIFRHFGLRQTFFVPGWCVEAYPATVEQILAAGHELGHHGYLHMRPNMQSRDQEATIVKTTLIWPQRTRVADKTARFPYTPFE